MINACGECKRYVNCIGEKYGVCDANMDVVDDDYVCHAFERRIDMDKTITINLDRYEAYVRTEMLFEVAQALYRNSDTYDADKQLAHILGPRQLPAKDKCETI